MRLNLDRSRQLLEPDRPPVARIVALPDADWSPEMLAGLASGVEPAAQFARRLAENGSQVLVPVLIDRADTWSANPQIQKTTNVNNIRTKKADHFFSFLWPRSLSTLFSSGSGSQFQNTRCHNRRSLSRREPSSIGRGLSCLAHDSRKRYDYYGFEDDGIPDNPSKQQIPRSPTAIATTVSTPGMTSSANGATAKNTVTPSASAGPSVQPPGNSGLSGHPLQLSVVIVGATGELICSNE